jgi:hypothetical protein
MRLSRIWGWPHVYLYYHHSSPYFPKKEQFEKNMIPHLTCNSNILTKKRAKRIYKLMRFNLGKWNIVANKSFMQ